MSPARGRRRPHAWLETAWWLAWLAAACYTLMSAAAAAPPPPPPPVFVSQAGGPCTSPTGACLTFADALMKSGALDIVLIMDITLQPSDFADVASLYVLDRNVTVRALPCVGVRRLNFDFLKAKVLMADFVVVTFEWLRMVRAREVSDASIDLFLGGYHSAIVLRNCEHYRFAGLPPYEVKPLTTSYPRPERFPGVQTVTQITSGCRPDSMRDLVYNDLAVRLGGPGASGGPGGYDMRDRKSVV